MRKKLVVFVEGEGDAVAVPILVKRLLADLNAWGVVALDENAFRVGQVGRLVARDHAKWLGWLKAALKRGRVGGILVVLDGDIKQVGGQLFCAKRVAAGLARAARQVGAGQMFSVAVTFAVQEFESWLIAGAESLVGKCLPDSRPALRDSAQIPTMDIEAIRDAKGWFRKNLSCGYKETRDQAYITQLVEVDSIRARDVRSFARFESAVFELVEAIREDRPVATPTESERDDD